MKYLLDTNAFIFNLFESRRLTPQTINIIKDPYNRIYLSVASVWEMAIKYQKNGLYLPDRPNNFIPSALKQQRILKLDIDFEHVATVDKLPLHHKDPFDRLIIKQAQLENMTIITSDKEFKRYDVPIIKAV